MKAGGHYKRGITQIKRIGRSGATSRGATSLSAVLAAVSSAAKGTRTTNGHGQMEFPAVPPAMPSRLPTTPLPYRSSMRELPSFVMLLGQIPPLVFKGGLSTATARPWWAQGLNMFTRCRPKQPIKPGTRDGSAVRRRSQVRRVGTPPCSVNKGRNCFAYGVILLNKCDQGISRVKAAKNHDDQGLQHEPIQIGFGRPRGRWAGAGAKVSGQ